MTDLLSKITNIAADIYTLYDIHPQNGVSYVVPVDGQVWSQAGTGVVPSGSPMIFNHVGWRHAIVMLKATNVATAAGDTLDVFIDGSVDGGNTYINIIHFNQILGNGGNKTYLAYTSDPDAGVMTAGTDLNAGDTPRPLFGQVLRVRYNLVNTSGTGTFTVSIAMEFRP